MSLFLLQIQDEFENQKFSIDNNGLYYDETFRFNKNDIRENYRYNCFISQDDNKNIEFYEDTFNTEFESHVKEWRNKSYDHPDFKCDDKDAENAFKYYVRYGGKNSEYEWKTNWKNILINNKDNLSSEEKLKLDKELFKHMCLKKKYKDDIWVKNLLLKFDQIYEVKRISQLKDYHKYKIFENEINCNNINQGRLGTCYFLEALSVLSNKAQLIYQLFPTEELNNKGIYQIILYHNGKWKKVFIDDYLVFHKGTNNFFFTRPMNYCLYTCFLEKAYAKILGSYADANGGFEEDAFKALTGFETLVFDNQFFGDNLYNYAIEKLNDGNLLSCSIIGHAYSILDIHKNKVNKDIIKFKTRNPWGCLKKEEKNFKYNDINTGIFDLIKNNTKDEFKDYFKGNMAICQTLFNSTVFNFKLDDITRGKIYFCFEIFEDSKISVGMYKTIFENNKLVNEPIFKEVKLQYRDLNKNEGYKDLILDQKFEKIWTNKTKNDKYYNYDYNKKRIYNYNTLKKSKYILSIDFNENNLLIGNPNTFFSGKKLEIIIEGNIPKIDYLGYNDNNINNIKIFSPKFERYNYGMITGIMFKKFKKEIKLLEKEFDAEMHQDAKGIYIETIYTKEVKTIILVNKKTPKLQEIISHNLSNNIYFTGNNQKNGKINGAGAAYDKNLNLIKRGEIDQNKFIVTEFNDKDNKLCITFPNLFKFNENSYTKNILHPHPLKYRIASKDFICEFCEKIFHKDDECFSCKTGGCDFDLCIKCLYAKDMEINLLKNKLRNCIFKIDDINKIKNIYGYFIKSITKNNEVYLFINKYFEDIKKANNNDYFEINLFNNKKIKIYIKNIKEYYIFCDQKFCFYDYTYSILILDKTDFTNYNNDINHLEYDTNIISNTNFNLTDYDYNSVLIPYISNQEIELKFGVTNIDKNDNKIFKLKNCEQKEYMLGMPIILLKNSKIIGKYKYKSYFNEKICTYINQEIDEFLNGKKLNKNNKIILEKRFHGISEENLIRYCTVISNDSRALIRYDIKHINNNDYQQIVSYDTLNKVYFLGKAQEYGKITSQGTCIEYDEENNICTLLKSECFIAENKIFYCFRFFDTNDKENKLYLIKPELFNLNEYTIVKSFLHNDELKYKSAKVNWYCDFCLNKFNASDPGFGCRNCNKNGFDLCTKCIFLNQNDLKNKIYIKLKESEVNIISYNINQFIIKSLYHNHNLKFKSYYSQYNCSICDKKSKNFFICENCNFYFCTKCLYNQKEIFDLKNNLNNCIFRLKQNNNVYGYFLKRKNSDYINIVINLDYNNSEKYISNDSLDILLLNNKNVKINLNEVLNYFIFHEDDMNIFFCIYMKYNYFSKDKINTFEYDETIVKDINKKLTYYNNKSIYILSINEDNKIELNLRKLNKALENDISKFLELPILLTKNNKIIGEFKKSPPQIKQSLIPIKLELYNKNKFIINKIFSKYFTINSELNKSEIIFAKDIISVMKYDNNKTKIVSYDMINNIYFIGEKHCEGKITDNGKCLQYYEDKDELKILKSGFIWDNKFYFGSTIFDPNNTENKLYLTMPNLFDFDSDTKAISFLHKDKLKYNSANFDWWCDFCNKLFKKNDPNFGCRECDYDLCPKCLFEDSNNERNKTYIKLNQKNIDIKKFTVDEFNIKSIYHNLNLIYNNKSNNTIINGTKKCIRCENKIADNFFGCNSCEFYLCLNCVCLSLNDKKILLEKLNKSMFKIDINENINNIFGVLSVPNITNYQEIIICINFNWEELLNNIKEDFIELLFFNNEKIKIFLKDIIGYKIFNTKRSEFFIDKSLIKGDNIDYLIERKDNLKNYDNKLVIAVYINDDNKLELDYGVYKSFLLEENKFHIIVKNLEEKTIKKNPLLALSAQSKNIIIKVNFKECPELIKESYKCDLNFILNLTPNYSDFNLIMKNRSEFFVEEYNEYNNTIKAQIQLYSVIFYSAYPVKNLKIIIPKDKKLIRYVNIPFQGIGNLNNYNRISNSEIELYKKFSYCPEYNWPFLGDNFSLSYNTDNNIKIFIKSTKNKKISPYGIAIAGNVEIIYDN